MATKVKLIADNVITTDQIDLTSIDTDNLSEGSTNLYFTNARVDSHLSGGTGVTYSSGAISIGQAVATDSNVTFADLTVTGDLNITGDINSYNVTDLDVTDQTITLGAGQIESNSGGSGIIIDGSGASLLWNETNNQFDFNKTVNVTSGNMKIDGNQVGLQHVAQGIASGNSVANNFQIGRWKGSTFDRWMLVPVNNGSEQYSDEFGYNFNTGAWFFDDKLGIGIADADSKLHISGTTITGGIFVEDSSTASSSPVIKVQGKRSDANKSQSFSGGLVLESLYTGGLAPDTKHTGTIYFGINHTDGTASNIAYSASISGILEGDANSASDMPTGLVFYTGDAGTALGAANTTYGTERMRIASTGNVGIGTGSDTLNGTLNVKGGVNSIVAYSTTTTDQPGLFAGNNSAFNTSTNTLYAKIYGSGITASAFGVTLADYAVVATEGTDNNGLLIGSFNNAPIIFGTNNTNRMTLTADGKLNLNVALTKSSGPVLDLEPNANIDGSYYSALTINEQHSTAHSGLRFDRSGTPKYRIGIDNSDNFQIANFRTTTDDAAFVMDVDSDIGIGTASPASSLHIHRDSNENSPEIRITTGKDSGTPTAQMSYSAGSGYFLRLPDAANNEDVMIRSYGDTVFHGGSVSIGDQLKVGSFTLGQTNTGEAWLGRASDRNQGTLTVQLGGGTTGRKFEIVDHDWQKVLMQIDGNAESGSLTIPATGGGSAGNTGIIMKNKHPGNAEPYTSLDVRELQTTNGYGGIGMYSNLQSHLRFKTGGGATTWGNGTGHQWQLRMGNGAAEDQMEFYAWTGNKRVQRMYGSNGAHTMEYQLGGRFGLPSNQTVTTSWSNLNFSDTNSTYLMYNQGLTNSSGEITVPVAGRYAISARFRTEATPFRPPTQFAIYIDNSGSGSGTFVQIVRLYITSNTQSSYEHAPPLDGIFNLVAGARFVIRAIAGTGSFVLSSTSNTVNHLSVMKLA